ncbi:MAG: hypothetical protein KDB99_03975 [Chitinophagaceae bacterium]|nr:hypothetical protein [Chitinophagaceae bacterium]
MTCIKKLSDKYHKPAKFISMTGMRSDYGNRLFDFLHSLFMKTNNLLKKNCKSTVAVLIQKEILKKQLIV